tara:strand:- start:942 stop:1352 length:411 start_codon:yes stop_codon:yes gene_type:complete
MKTIILNSDHVGILSSCLCLAHCVLTPLFFLYQVEISSLTGGATFFWYSLNYLFLIISFFAVSRSIKYSSNKSIKNLMLISWFLLSGLILNEQLELFLIPEFFSYSAGISLCFFHIYNLKFCRCEDENCCDNTVKK